MPDGKPGRVNKESIGLGMREIFTRAACAHYVVTGNKTDSYAIYINAIAKSGTGEISKTKHTAQKFFGRDDIKILVSTMEQQVKKRLLNEYLYELGISERDITLILKKKGIDIDDEAEVSRDIAIKNLKEIGDSSENDLARIQAWKAISDIAALKKQEKKDDGKDNIVYFLPMRVCDECPNAPMLISKYADEERMEDIRRALKGYDSAEEEMDNEEVDDNYEDTDEEVPEEY